MARRRSFTAAARALSVTQGAVSHRIRALERHLGQPLFLRTTRRVELTESGQILARACEEAFSVLDDALRRIQPAAESEPVMVSCSPSFAIRWLVPHIPELRAAGLEVRIAADDRLVTPGRGGIDVCIRYGPGGYPDADVRRLSVERVTPVCSPSLLADGAALQHPADLSRQILLHDEVLLGHPGRVGWTRWLEAADAAGSAGRGVRFSHAYMALEAAIAGQGVALARGILVARDLAEGRLVRPFELALESGLSYWVLTPARRPREAALRFRDWLLEEVNAAD